MLSFADDTKQTIYKYIAWVFGFGVLRMDEGTPHIHERHVFDCKNRYGELCPQQEKALEELGIPLPSPDKPKGKNNNRKQTFDSICRTILFDISRRYGVHLEQEPSYGGRDYLEKQDFIIEKQKKILSAQGGSLDEKYHSHSGAGKEV